MDLGPFKLKVKTDMERYRADTWQTKEPETLYWIRSFKPGFRFMDIGANIGIYSLYCASLDPGRPIDAFEPHKANYSRLRDNMKLNRVYSATLHNIAIGAERGRTIFYVNNTETGTSGSQIDKPIDEYGKVFEASSEEVFCDTLDNLLKNRGGVYVKIDVDGHEWDIIKGIGQRGVRIKSLLVEVNHDRTSVDELDYALKQYGLFRDKKINRMKPHSSERRRGNPTNIVYTRINGLEYAK